MENGNILLDREHARILYMYVYVYNYIDKYAFKSFINKNNLSVNIKTGIYFDLFLKFKRFWIESNICVINLHKTAIKCLYILFSDIFIYFNIYVYNNSFSTLFSLKLVKHKTPALKLLLCCWVFRIHLCIYLTVKATKKNKGSGTRNMQPKSVQLFLKA